MGLSNSSKHDELSCILTTKNLTFRHWWLDIRGFLHVVAWQIIPKWRLRGPRFKIQGAQIQDPGLWRATLVVHHFFSHLITFCTHNNHSATLGLVVHVYCKFIIQSWLRNYRMQRSLIGKQSDSPVGIAYFTGDCISLHRSGYELCSVVLKVSCFFGQSSHIIDKICDQIFTSLLTKGKNMVK